MARRVSIALALDYQKCRSKGHWWDDFIPDPGTHPRRNAGRRPWGEENQRCTRCTTECLTTFNAFGAVLTRTYYYPDGYSLPADERPTADELRVSLKRAREDGREDAGRRRKQRKARKIETAPRGTARVPSTGSRSRHLQAVG